MTTELTIIPENEIVRAHNLVRQGFEDIKFFSLYCGALLTHQKEVLKHGEFRPLLKKCGISKSSAQRYMQVAANILPKCPTVGHLPLDEIVAKLPKLQNNSRFQGEVMAAMKGRTLIEMAQDVKAIPGPSTRTAKALEAEEEHRQQGAPPRTAMAKVYSDQTWEQLSFLDEHIEFLDTDARHTVALASGLTLVKLGYSADALRKAGVPVDAA